MDVEFLAEETLVDVVPTFRHAELEFLSGHYSSIVPQRVTRIPLWLASKLKDRCSREEEATADEEMQDHLLELPWHHAGRDPVRSTKIRAGLMSVARQSRVEPLRSVKMSRLTATEVAGLRLQLLLSLRRFSLLTPPKHAPPVKRLRRFN